MAGPAGPGNILTGGFQLPRRALIPFVLHHQKYLQKYLLLYGPRKYTLPHTLFRFIKGGGQTHPSPDRQSVLSTPQRVPFCCYDSGPSGVGKGGGGRPGRQENMCSGLLRPSEPPFPGHEAGTRGPCGNQCIFFLLPPFALLLTLLRMYTPCQPCPTQPTFVVASPRWMGWMIHISASCLPPPLTPYFEMFETSSNIYPSDPVLLVFISYPILILFMNLL